MPLRPRASALTWCVFLAAAATATPSAQAKGNPGTKLQLNEQGYFSAPGADVMAFQDIYPEGHQGGVGIIQNGVRVATNGDLRLEPAPGQWAPVPVQKDRAVDRAAGEIVTTLAYPDPDKDRKGFNPLEYPRPALQLQGARARRGRRRARHRRSRRGRCPRPGSVASASTWSSTPAALFGSTFYAGDGAPGDDKARAPASSRASPTARCASTTTSEVQPEPLATGHRLVVAPEEPAQQLTIESARAPLALLDGRVNHPNGWFVVRALIPAGATARAIDWLIDAARAAGLALAAGRPRVAGRLSPGAAQGRGDRDRSRRHQRAARDADSHRRGRPARDGRWPRPPRVWGRFLRYRYLQFDFSGVRRDGVYQVEYGPARTEPFRIARDVYKRGVWQPTLGTFLPVQMCHMRVVEKYRVWHGLCHMDDARMAPSPDTTTSTGTRRGRRRSRSGSRCNQSPGWRSAAGTTRATTICASNRRPARSTCSRSRTRRSAFPTTTPPSTSDAHLVEIRQPDGKPDILQQIEHGLLGVIGAWKALGRFPRGVIVPTLRQYTDGRRHRQPDRQPGLRSGPAGRASTPRRRRRGLDDRMVFTEQNPARALTAAAYVAAGARAMRGFDDALAADALRAAEETWRAEGDAAVGAGDDGIIARLHAATELLPDHRQGRLSPRADRRRRRDHRARRQARVDRRPRAAGDQRPAPARSRCTAPCAPTTSSGSAR